MRDEIQNSVTLDRISAGDALFLDRIRGISILRVVLAHLGLSWIYTPYSQFIHAFLPVLFFVSGAVSFYSFKRSPNLKNYAIRRVLSVSMPYYIIASGVFISLWVFEKRVPDLNLYEVFRWLMINPDYNDISVPLGQVWFIHTMVIMILISIPFFVLSANSSFPLLFLIIFSASLSLLNQVYDIGSSFYFIEHKLYNPLINIGFFAFGAYYYLNKYLFTVRVLIFILLLLVISIAVNIAIVGVDINIANNSFYPNTYHLSCSFFGIITVLLCKPIIDGVLNKSRVLDWFFLFLSKHAYSVFMLHSVVIVVLEVNFNLIDVAKDPALALLKIFLVFLITCFLAVPVTYISKRVTKYVQKFFLPREQVSIKEKLAHK